MEADKKSKIELADFIYRDSARIASLTAQLFGGQLLNIEVTQTGKESSEKGVGLATPITGAYKAAAEKAVSEKLTRQPHDAAAADLIINLGIHGRISDNAKDAKAGSIVRATGMLFFVDGSLLQIAGEFFNTSALFADKPDLALVGQLTRVIQMPASFLLKCKDIDIVGTLDASGLHEPISSIYFKHGGAGLVDVGVVGIKEGTLPGSEENVMEASPFFKAALGYAKVIHQTLFPSNGIRIAPIAIYRIIH